MTKLQPIGLAAAITHREPAVKAGQIHNGGIFVGHRRKRCRGSSDAYEKRCKYLIFIHIKTDYFGTYNNRCEHP